jgi:hypothetical protein
MVWNIYFAIYIYTVLGMSSSQLTNSYFSEGSKPPTRKDCPFTDSNNSTYQVVAIRSQLGIHVDDLSWPVGATDKVS